MAWDVYFLGMAAELSKRMCPPSSEEGIAAGRGGAGEQSQAPVYMEGENLKMDALKPTHTCASSGKSAYTSQKWVCQAEEYS